MLLSVDKWLLVRTPCDRRRLSKYPRALSSATFTSCTASGHFMNGTLVDLDSMAHVDPAKKAERVTPGIAGGGKINGRSDISEGAQVAGTLWTCILSVPWLSHGTRYRSRLLFPARPYI